MINVKITMVNGTEYNLRNAADSTKEAYKRIIAPYGTNMSFVEILPETIISISNIVSLRKLSEEEVNAINEPEVEEVVGLTETEVEVKNENAEKLTPEASQ